MVGSPYRGYTRSMARTVCESSLRPDWLTRTFKSASSHHQQEVWELVQSQVARLEPNIDWEQTNSSRHFETCFKHECGVRFELAGLDAERNKGLSVVTLTGEYWGLASVYEQMRLIEEFESFKGGYHWTRLDAQVTTLNPAQSAEQICDDVERRVLWVKGYQGWKCEGLRNVDGEPVNGLSAVFGSPTSDRRAESYNKAAEQNWDTPARRDEVRLRGDWAERHMADIASGIAGASCENEALSAYVTRTSNTIAQHMQYLDITGTPKPRPKDWARGKSAPQWWKDTLMTEHKPLKKSRKVQSDVWERMRHMKMQWGPTFIEACAALVKEGHAESVEQAAVDIAMGMLQGQRQEHIDRVVEGLPKDLQQSFRDEMYVAGNRAAVHSEFC